MSGTCLNGIALAEVAWADPCQILMIGPASEKLTRPTDVPEWQVSLCRPAAAEGMPDISLWAHKPGHHLQSMGTWSQRPEATESRRGRCLKERHLGLLTKNCSASVCRIKSWAEMT